MEKFEKNEDGKLRAESIMDDVTHLRNGELEDKTGLMFRATQRFDDILKDKITQKNKPIKKKEEIIEELKERRREFEIVAKDKSRLNEAIKNIEEIDQLILKFQTENEINSIENEGLINKLTSNKSKPEDNIWKN